MSSEQKAVEDIETLGIGWTIGPSLDVTRAQELLLVDPGDRAPPAPIIDEVWRLWLPPMPSPGS